MEDVLSRVMIPICATTASVIVALMAIRRADQRERDKQRREDLIKTGTDFFEACVRVEEVLMKETRAVAKLTEEEAQEARKVANQEFLLVHRIFNSLNKRLWLLGEPDLALSVSVYSSEAFDALEQVRTCMSTPSIDDAVFHARCEINRLNHRQRCVSDRFVQELDALRQAERLNLMVRLQKWKKRLAEFWSRL